MTMKRTVLGLLLCGAAMQAAITNVQVVGVTSTQAVISYTAPSGSSCTVEVSESSSYTPLVYDVDSSLFSGANSDARAGSVTNGTDRSVVIAKRSVELALDGKYRSRALASDTVHYYRITCGADTATGSFRTATIPVGLTWNDPVPANLPYLDPNDKTATAIWPLTGVKYRRAVGPRDIYEQSGPNAASTPPDATTWLNEGNVVANDAASATYSGSARDWMFIPFSLGNSQLYQGSGFVRDQQSVNWIQASLNASGAAAAAGDRTVEVCLTASGGAQCDSDTLTQALTTSLASYTLGSTTPLMASWFGNGVIRFDRNDMYAKTGGTVNTSGTAVTRLGGPVFSPLWRSGSRITINSVEYLIASVESEDALTLQSTAGTQSGVSWSATNFGVMIRKSSTSTDSISIQHVTISHENGANTTWPTSADSASVGCSTLTRTGPSGTGRLCVFDNGIYWMNDTTGASNYIMSGRFPARAGGDGWDAGYMTTFGYAVFSTTNADTFYTGATNAGGQTLILSIKYYGTAADVGPQALGTLMTECDAGYTNTPCVDITNVTPPSGGTLNSKVSAFHSDWSSWAYNANALKLVGGQCGYLILESRSVTGTNDVLGWLVVFNPATGNVIAASPSYKYWPLRWGVLHGFTPMDSCSYLTFPQTYFRGNASGSDSTAGYGPYRSQITSGALTTTGSACPARPSDSPIPVSEWPTGSNCVQVTVGGEPTDPTPASGESATLVNAAVRDVFCGVASISENCSTSILYSQKEFFRLLIKTGNTWDLQRHYGDGGSMLALAANSYLIAMPPSCKLNSIYPCSGAGAYWDFVSDPTGTGTGIYRDSSLGSGHGSSGAASQVASVIDSGCPTLDGRSNHCYATRAGSYPAVFSTSDTLGSNNPAFAAKLGLGEPNMVDGHPVAVSSMFGMDGRPLLGADGYTGSSASQATLVSGSLWKFTAAQLTLNRKRMPTVAVAGTTPLTDISSATTGDTIGTTSSDNWKYCVALAANECRTGSAVGDVYFNVPYLKNKYGYYPGAGSEGGYENSSVVITDNGAHTMGFTQFRVDVPDVQGRRGRVLVHFPSYQKLNIFGHPKPQRSGNLFLFPWATRWRQEMMVGVLPPWREDSSNRGTFTPLEVQAGTGISANRLVVAFGYNTNYNCTTRNEACYATATTISESAPFSFASELTTTSGPACSGGCTVVVPSIGGRVVYYRLYNNNSGTLTAVGPMRVAVVQ